MRTVDPADRSSVKATKKEGRGWGITYTIWAELFFLFPRLRQGGRPSKIVGKIYVVANAELKQMIKIY